MLWIILLATGVYSECQSGCYSTCLSENSLNTCSQKCCKFKNIAFEDGNVFFIDGNEKILVEMEEVYFDIQKYSVNYKPAQTEVTTYKKSDVQSNPFEGMTFNSVCEKKCSKHCSTQGLKCYNWCSDKFCSAKEPEQSPNYLWYAILGIGALYLMKKYVISPKYDNGYVKLD